MVAVTFEVVSLHTSTFSESVFLLIKTFLELLFWNALQDGRLMSLYVGNVGPSKRSSVLVIAKNRTGPKLANMVDDPISISIFWPKTPGQRARHGRGIVMMQDPSIRPKFRSSPTNSLT
jgi:hypothetical protein